MKILGIDPGLRGGLAIVVIDDGAAPQLVDAIDIPVSGVGAKERVNALAIRDWIVKHQPQHAYIERAQAMPKHQKMRPEFTIVKWREIGGGSGGGLQNEPARQIEQKKPDPAAQVGRPVKPVTTKEELNDAIPF